MFALDGQGSICNTGITYSGMCQSLCKLKVTMLLPRLLQTTAWSDQISTRPPQNGAVHTAGARRITSRNITSSHELTPKEAKYRGHPKYENQRAHSREPRERGKVLRSRTWGLEGRRSWGTCRCCPIGRPLSIYVRIA